MKRAALFALVLPMLTACGHGAMIRGDVQPLAPLAMNNAAMMVPQAITK